MTHFVFELHYAITVRRNDDDSATRVPEREHRQTSEGWIDGCYQKGGCPEDRGRPQSDGQAGCSEGDEDDEDDKGNEGGADDENDEDGRDDEGNEGGEDDPDSCRADGGRCAPHGCQGGSRP